MSHANPAPAAKSAAPEGYWPSPWPGEDGGPNRSQAPHQTPGLAIKRGERLQITSRDAFATTMVILREPGEVFVLRHTLGARGVDSPTSGWVERIDPGSLEVVDRSPHLAAGPFWPGGLAAHANGSLYTVFGRWCHRLHPDCSIVARRELPQPRPYNSFVILPDGTLVMKDLDLELRRPARLALLEPSTLTPRCAEIVLPEPVVARLSAEGDSIYIVGISTVYRYVWDPRAERLERDDSWQLRYRTQPGQAYGWDPVIEGGHVWFLDNGEHTYTTSMLGSGVAPGPVHIVRASLGDCAEHELVEVCGQSYGAITNPPLYDPGRRICLGFDSANAMLAAWRLSDGGLEPLWRRPFATASHLIRYPDTGEVVVGDFHDGLPRIRQPTLRRLARRSTWLAGSRRVRTAAARRCHDDIVVIDIETGEERARGQAPSMFQSVVFPAAGFGRDLYYCTMSTLVRAAVI